MQKIKGRFLDRPCNYLENMLLLLTTCNSLVVSFISLLQIGQRGTWLLLKLSLTQQLQDSDAHSQIFTSSTLISSMFFLPNPIAIYRHLPKSKTLTQNKNHLLYKVTNHWLYITSVYGQYYILLTKNSITYLNASVKKF